MSNQEKVSKKALVCIVQEDKTPREAEITREYLDKLAFTEVKYAQSDPSKQVDGYYYDIELGTISSVDSHNKKSKRHYNCLSLVGFSERKQITLSFMAHINSVIASSVSSQNGKRFIEQLKSRLRELKLDNGSNIEVCVLAGDKDDLQKMWAYSKAIVVLKKIVKEAVGVDLKVMDEEFTTFSRKDIYSVNDSRRIYQIAEETTDYN